MNHNYHNQQLAKKYTCPVHPEVIKEKPMDHSATGHGEHVMRPVSEISWWDKFKMKQNLFWASIYNLLAIPVAAGVLYPTYNISLRPEFAALLMSVSSIIVATNAVLLNRAEKDLIEI